MANLYKGFSSFEFLRNRTFRLNDIELVKMDLLNHIFTRKGERVNMPTFGTRIPDMAFEPLDEITIEALREDLETVFNFDPRVEQIELRIEPNADNNSVTASATLLYLEFRVTEDLNIVIDVGTQS